MPHPTNLDTALSVERNVASTGAVPATIGLIGGRIKYGLERGELEYLADTTTESVKLSRRDLAAAMALKRDGGTTCSTTLILAALAGIKVFATGGLGGVHRGGENSMDVSADLLELSRSPVGLVSAGVKSILDIGRTLEYLETIGVPVFTYGKTNDFPAFYSRRSGFKSPWRLDDPQTAAQVLLTHDKLNINTGVLFGVPIPETYEAIGERIQEAVEQAVAESEGNGMAKRGKEATPWLLKRVGELTEGKSLASNIALIENTALVGGRIAVEHAKLIAEQDETRGSNTYSVPGLNSSDSLPLPVTVPTSITSTTTSTSSASSPLPLPPAKLVVIGSAAIDITAQVSPTVDPTGTKGLYSTSPGRVSLSLGGV
ncbi:uncharacterized protein STEHIDRAFT_117545, partial [Stereum hirsutum FP-91666 SS1]|uniref:uncharacterized protein n=1 Tax=Stereum hirsutum (strain FP-91666) TaxID=721885 RepID=UPI000440A4F8